MEEKNESGSFRVSDKFLWAIVCAALGVGGSSGIYTATSVQDRYTGSDFAKDIRPRDDAIEYQAAGQLKLEVEINKLRDRVRELELELARASGGKRE